MTEASGCFGTTATLPGEGGGLGMLANLRASRGGVVGGAELTEDVLEDGLLDAG